MPCKHIKRREGVPQVSEECVNIDNFCVDCGQRVGIISWSREAWDKEQEKRAKSPAPATPDD